MFHIRKIIKSAIIFCLPHKKEDIANKQAKNFSTSGARHTRDRPKAREMRRWWLMGFMGLMGAHGGSQGLMGANRCVMLQGRESELPILEPTAFEVS